MHREFRINCRRSVGNLHIHLSGAFSSRCAWVLFKTIMQHRTGSGRVFVNTKDIEEVMPAGADLFKGHMNRAGLTPGRLFFKGEKGQKIAPDGSRVLVCRKSGHRDRRPLQAPAPMRNKAAPDWNVIHHRFEQGGKHE